MDLFDVKPSLGVSRSHFVKDQSTIVNAYQKAVAAQFYRKSLLKADRSNRSNHPVNRETFEVHNFPHSFAVRN